MDIKKVYEILNALRDLNKEQLNKIAMYDGVMYENTNIFEIRNRVRELILVWKKEADHGEVTHLEMVYKDVMKWLKDDNK